MTLFFIASAAFIATICGGLFALRLSDKLHLILGFSAGAVLGVAFFDLMPEAIELGQKFHDLSTLFAVMALGFASYLVMDRLVFLHGHTHETADDHRHHQTTGAARGNFGASTLSFHSMLDGLAIGFAFQVSPAVGVVVASAVLAHDFSDGINTVSFIMKQNYLK
jgi:ZIP family zinc transporter